MTLYAPRVRASTVKPHRPIGTLDSPPADFDPTAYPILARHFFNVEPSQQISDTTDMAARHRRQRQIEHLHRLGERAVGELLREAEDGEDVGTALEAYGRLTPDLLKRGTCPRTVRGDRQGPHP